MAKVFIIERTNRYANAAQEEHSYKDYGKWPKMKELIHEYKEKHGPHFTEALAEYASKMMVNANGQEHSWTSTQVKKALEGLGLSVPESATLGDITYAANMAYADYYPEVIKDEASCLKFAIKMVNDPDGYKGKIFEQFKTDVKHKLTEIEWKTYI